MIKNFKDFETKVQEEIDMKGILDFDEEPRIKPLPIDKIDISVIISNCESHLDEMYKGREDDGGEHWIYEACMEAVYGKDVWKTINPLV